MQSALITAHSDPRWYRSIFLAFLLLSHSQVAVDALLSLHLPQKLQRVAIPVTYCVKANHHDRRKEDNDPHPHYHPPPPPNRKLEAAAVKRFASYDKLCKNCPTLLQPRVDTLTEMIMGLSAGERSELLASVGRRMEECEPEEGSVSGVRTAKDVYDFQVAAAAAHATTTDSAAASSANPKPAEHATERERRRIDTDKLRRKMDKTRGKLEQNKIKAFRANRLLEVTTTLLLGEGSRVVENPTDNLLYHEIDELRSLAREELLMQRLKYECQKVKYEQKLAKGRTKLYVGSLKLTKAGSKEYV